MEWAYPILKTWLHIILFIGTVFVLGCCVEIGREAYWAWVDRKDELEVKLVKK